MTRIRHSSEPTKETWELLQNLILDGIIGSIKANLEVGNITEEDATELRELTMELYEHLYHHYQELGGYQDMKELLEGAMVLPLDKYRIKIDELTKQLETERAQAEKEKEEKAKAEEEKAKAEEEKAKAEEEKVKLEKELQLLRAQLAKLQK